MSCLTEPVTLWTARPTSMTVPSLAQALRVRPAIVAGGDRYERPIYRLLSQFVGTGAVSRQL